MRQPKIQEIVEAHGGKCGLIKIKHKKLNLKTCGAVFPTALETLYIDLFPGVVDWEDNNHPIYYSFVGNAILAYQANKSFEYNIIAPSKGAAYIAIKKVNRLLLKEGWSSCLRKRDPMDLYIIEHFPKDKAKLDDLILLLLYPEYYFSSKGVELKLYPKFEKEFYYEL